MRIFFAVLFLSTVAVAIGGVFWKVELQYILPTPVPDDYQEVYVNHKVYLNDTSEAILEKPVFYHFFTTNCPCSRFNLSHFNQLKERYGDEFDFYVVLPEEDDISEARQYFEGETKIILDRNKEFALRTGVYSTPQAVIIGTDHRLYFRGNYNRARYCTDPFSNYAQMAIDSLRADVPAPEFGPLSTIAYGCGIY